MDTSIYAVKKSMRQLKGDILMLFQKKIFFNKTYKNVRKLCFC